MFRAVTSTRVALARPLARRFFSTDGPTKTSTGLVGLKVHPDPIPAIIKANQQLRELVKMIPEGTAYR
jgi:hypothetical protein